MGRTRGKKKSGSRNSRKSDFLQRLIKQPRLQEGGGMRWMPTGTYAVTSIVGARDNPSCGNTRAGIDGPPETATFFRPVSIECDSAGNIILTERDTDAKIRMMTPEGRLITLMRRGGGLNDGLLASQAQVSNIGLCAVNKANDVIYFAEINHHRLRNLIADTGRTVSGKSAPGFSAGITTIIATGGNDTRDGDQGAAVFHHPNAIGVDPNGRRMYIGENSSTCLRMVDITGARSCYVSTLFSANTQFSFIVVDSNRNVFFTLNNKHGVWKYVPPPAGTRTTGGRSAPLCNFDDPIKGPKLFAGNADTSGYRDSDDGLTARFNRPMGLCVDTHNNVYVADRRNNIIRYITPDGKVYTYAGVQSLDDNITKAPDHGDGSHMTARFSNPIAVTTDAQNNLFVLDQGINGMNVECPQYCRIRKVSVAPPVTINAVTADSVTVSWPPPSEWDPSAPPGEDTYTYSYSITPEDREFEVLDVTIGSPLTISNLSDSGKYSLQIIVKTSTGATRVITPPVVFITKFDPLNFNIKTPVTTTISGKDNTVPNIATTVLEWQGARGADTFAYTISPPDFLSRTTVMLPKHQKPPYCIADLDADKSYTITLTATITNAPGVTGAPLETLTTTSPPSIFRTAPPKPMNIGTICGIRSQGGAVTNASSIPRPASSTTINNPRGIVLDKHGNLYVSSNSCVLKIAPPKANMYVYMRGEVPSVFLPTPHTTSDSTVTIYAGQSFQRDSKQPSDAEGDDIRFYNMSGMAYDPIEDAIYVADSQLHIIVKLTTNSSGVVRSVILGKHGANGYKDGPVRDAEFNTPKGIAIGPDGSLFIADCYNHAVRRIYKGHVTTILRAKRGADNSIISEDLWYPYGMAALYDGSVYVTSTWRHCIKKLTPNPDGITYTTTLHAGSDERGGSNADGLLLNARFNKPQGLFVDINNNIYVYDAGNRAIKLLSGGRSMTIFGGEGYTDGNKNDARIMGPPNLASPEQHDFGGITADNNGNIYITDWGNGMIRCAFPEPPPVIDKDTFDNYWINAGASSAQAERSSAARIITASAARIQRASSAVANKASSAVAQVASSAVAQVASQAQASSSLKSRESSAVAQVASRAHASSARIQEASSSVAQTVSSALAQVESRAHASSAVAQGVSSALAQNVSSALAQVESRANASSAVAQGVSSALAQTVSSAVAQNVSSAVAQEASSAVAQEASSALAQEASSALAQVASSALARVESRAQASSAVAQVASSSRQQQALVQPVSVKDSVAKLTIDIKSDLTQQISVLYSKTTTESEKDSAKEFIVNSLPELQGKWESLSQLSARIFAIAPLYQDRNLQTPIYDDPYLESRNLIKMYDFMRRKYIVIDSNGYIVTVNDAVQKRLH